MQYSDTWPYVGWLHCLSGRDRFLCLGREVSVLKWGDHVMVFVVVCLFQLGLVSLLVF